MSNLMTSTVNRLHAAQLVLLVFSIQFTLVNPAKSQTKEEPQTIRTLYVPFEDLNILFDGSSQHVFLKRSEYDKLIKSAELAPVEETPADFLYQKSGHKVTIRGQYARIQSTLAVDLLSDRMFAIPIPLRNCSIQTASNNGKPAALGKNANNQVVAFVQGKGSHLLEFELVARMELETAQQRVGFQLPSGATSSLQVNVSGNVEITSGPAIIDRSYDQAENRTQFDLVPSRDYVNLEMSVNNKKLQEKKSILAKSVLLHEITSNYEQIHARINVDILYGSTDEVRFAMPTDFQLTEVSCPNLSQWSLDQADGKNELVVRLREAVSKSFPLNIAATSTNVDPLNWKMRRLKPVGFDGEISVVGILAEERFELQSLETGELITLDNQQLQSSIPETVFKTAVGAPAIQTVAAFFSPDGVFDLTAKFVKPDAKLLLQPSSILFLGDEKQKLIGQYQLSASHEKIIDFDLLVPADWRLMSVIDANSKPLSFQRFQEEEGTRINVRLPGGLGPIAGNTAGAQSMAVTFEAEKTSPQWSSDWQTTDISFPNFVVKNSELTTGAIAIVVEDDLAVRARQTSNLETLLKDQMAIFGLDGFNTSIAFEMIESDFSADLTVERLQPQITATTFSFIRWMNKRISANYELAFDVQTARARSLKFSLPDSTPKEIKINGLEGVRITQTESSEADGLRTWTVKLAEPRLGEVRLSVEFVQALQDEEPDDFKLPLIKSAHTGYQTTLAAFEGNPDFDIDLKTDMRSIDAGEMGDAQYVPGPRLLGAYTSVGSDSGISISVKRRDIHQLPAAIVESVNLTTVVAQNGKSQTEANYQIQTKVPFIELKLPPNAELWSVQLDGAATRPQIRGDSVLVSLPPDSTRRQRNLIVFYEEQISQFGLSGDVRMDAPKLVLPGNEKGQSEIPQASLNWAVTLPPGYKIASNNGTVHTTNEERRPLPLYTVAESLSGFLSSSITTVANDFAPQSQAKKSERSPSFGYGVDSMVNEEAEASEDFVRRSTAAGGEAKTESPPDSFYESGDDPFGDSPANEPAAPGGAEGMSGGGMGGAADPFGAAIPKSAGLIPNSAALPPPVNMPPTVKLPAPKIPPKKKMAKSFLLKGKRGLNITSVGLTISEGSQTVLLESLGGEPNVSITLVDQNRFDWFSFSYGALVFSFGLFLCRFSTRVKILYLMLIVTIAAVVPMVGDWTAIVWKGLEFSLFASVLLIVVYVAFTILKFFEKLIRKDVPRWLRMLVGSRTTSTIVLIGFLSAGSLVAQDAKSPPVQIPENVIIVPYDPENPDLESDQIFVPYARFKQLLEAADPDREKTQPDLPAQFGWSGTQYQTTLTPNYLSIDATLQFDAFTDDVISVPLSLNSAVITAATLDGQPAQLKVQSTLVPTNQQAEQAQQKAVPVQQVKQLLLVSRGKGQKTLKLKLRVPVQQSGGWRTAKGMLPKTPASKMTIKALEDSLEINDRSSGTATKWTSATDAREFDIVLGEQGQFDFSWRGSVSTSKVDQNLSVNSTALFDVRNDGLHLVWKLDFLFRASKREQFDVELPKDFEVVRTYGSNIRGWVVRDEGEVRVLDVTLLTEADSRESFTIELSNRKMDLSAPTSFPMPTVVIPDAAIHSGQITVRKSDSFELQTDTMIGISRIDISEARKIQPKAQPLFNPSLFQAFEFSRTPFSVAIQCRHKPRGLSVEARTLVDIREESCGLESQINCSSATPVHLLDIEIPADLEIQNIQVPVPFRRSIVKDEQVQKLTLFFAAGLKGDFAIQISGRLADHDATGEIELPKITVGNTVKQSGQISAIAEPQLIVLPSNLNNCETTALATVKSWLTGRNQSKARLGIRYRSTDYSGMIKVSGKPPIVNVTSITNVNMTLRSIEESIIINYDIRDNGVSQLSFRLPADLKDARIKADLIRELTIQPVDKQDADSDLQVTLVLQDLVIGQYRIVIENDRGLSNAKQVASIPTFNNVQSSKRFVTLQNSGFDELVVPDAKDVENLDRRQKPFRDLKALVGGADIRNGYMVKDSADSPLLTYQTNPRKLVDTVGASIGLSEIILSIDRAGAFRAEQTLFVDNRTEPFLEIEIPKNSTLWTVRVAGTSVKPIAVAESQQIVRIPLIKTADGDNDFSVEIKYGGNIGKLGNLSKIKFPFLETRNISIQSSNVRLMLPKDFDFYGFEGTLGVSEEKQIAAARKSYQTALFSKLKSQATNSKSDLVRQRAILNLRNINQDGQNGNAGTPGAEAVAELSQLNIEEQVDNRAQFNELLRGQKLQLFGNSGNLSNNYGGNFGDSIDDGRKSSEKPANSSINKEWFSSNGLVNQKLMEQNQSNRRFNAPGFTSGKDGKSKSNKDLDFDLGGANRQQMLGGRLVGGNNELKKARSQFKDQVSQNIDSLQLESRRARRQGNTRGEVLKKYAQQLDQTFERSKAGGQAGISGRYEGRPLSEEESAQELMDPQSGPIQTGAFAQSGEENGQFGFVAASLDVNFDHRGQEFLFQAPSGDLELEVTMVSKSLKRRSFHFMALFGVLAVLGCFFWFFKT